MALVLMCGQPCSGKSEAAACLTAALRSSSADLTVRIIDESSLHLERNDSYKGIGVAYHVGCCDMCNALTFMRLQGFFTVKPYVSYGFLRRTIALLWIIVHCLLYVQYSQGKNVTHAVWKDEIVESSPVIAEAVSYLTKKLDSKTRDVKVLQPTIATQTVRTTEVNSLYEMDKATQEVVNAIVEAQSCGLGLAMNKISLGPNMPTISFTD
ncbi:hypothetical protein PR202_gb22858 [Eleusine coracana subsp. coracana]|uniref:Uncharacterized protein n=1 Tax=Eleusine coracana subsp. coracana TaxID=191504 RepID=A0AAV5FEV5_ELECO|nr:hypothetical protein PR202_gb22858 [Eleusine coracana subsp. coracana]